MQAIIVNQYRGKVIEEIHHVEAVIDVDGTVDVFGECLPHLMRSTAKPYQLSTLIKSMKNSSEVGDVLSDEELSFLSSSHNGENYHIELLKTIASKFDIDLKNLQCGTHLPFFKWIKNHSKLSNNCSGKHLAMLILCSIHSYTTKNYCSPNHPLQKLISRQMNGYLKDVNIDLTLEIDGCGVPTYGISLDVLVRLYKLSTMTSRHPDVRRIFKAIHQFPYANSGKKRFELMVMQSTQLIAKSGAKGIMICASLDGRFVACCRALSGNDEAAESAMGRILKHYGLLTNDIWVSNNEIFQPAVYTTTGVNVGYYKTGLL